MSLQEQVNELLKKALENNDSIFLIDAKISDSNKIVITLDGDQGVTLQDCINVSRAIEHNLNREEHDFELEVTSAGLSSPLKFIRQYKKNIGKILEIETTNEKIEATLVKVTDDFIVLEWNVREQKKKGKGKETILKKIEIPYTEIRKAIVTIKY